jgi:hypothetical protein
VGKIIIDKKILEDLYVVKKLTIEKIAKSLGVSGFTVYERLKEFNIKIRPRTEAFKGKHHSEETKRKMSEVQKGRCVSEETRVKISKSRKGKMTGEKNHNYGKHLPEETRKKISEAKKGTHHSEETKAKMSKMRKGRFKGEKSPYWKGGRKLAEARMKSKRRKLGFNPLNKPFKNSEGHHLQDKETVIYIPKELHQRITHNNWRNINMNIIDALALYYLELQMLGEVV